MGVNRLMRSLFSSPSSQTGWCLHRWPYLPHLADPRVAYHVCGRRIGHRLPHRCRDCNAETSTQ